MHQLATCPVCDRPSPYREKTAGKFEVLNHTSETADADGQCLGVGSIVGNDALVTVQLDTGSQAA